jgi:hypothetical protein
MNFASMEIRWPILQKPWEILALCQLLSARRVRKVLEIGVALLEPTA